MDQPRHQRCPSCLSEVEVGDVPPLVCPSCKAPMGHHSAPAETLPQVHPQGDMVITLKVAAWVFVIAGIISGFSIYPSDPLAPGFTLDSYTAARLAAPSLKALAVQVALSGLVAGLFTGAFACMLEVLEQIRDRMK